MPKYLTRRRAIQTGIITTGVMAGTSYAQKLMGKNAAPTTELRFSGREWWTPGANRNYVRNLKHGPTPVRLACMSPETMMQYPKNESITGVVKRLVHHMRTEQHMIRDWVDSQAEQQREIKRLLEVLVREKVDR